MMASFRIRGKDFYELLERSFRRRATRDKTDETIMSGNEEIGDSAAQALFCVRISGLRPTSSSIVIRSSLDDLPDRARIHARKPSGTETRKWLRRGRRCTSFVYMFFIWQTREGEDVA